MVIARPFEFAMKKNRAALEHNRLVGRHDGITDESGDRRQRSAGEVFAIGLNDFVADDAEFEIVASLDHAREREMPQVRNEILRPQIATRRIGPSLPLLVPDAQDVPKNRALEVVECYPRIAALKLHEERLEDVAKKKEELKFRIEEKRLSLLELKKSQLDAVKKQDAALEQMIEETKRKVAEYSAKLAAKKPAKTDLVEQAKEAGLVRLGIKKNNGNGDEQIVRV